MKKQKISEKYTNFCDKAESNNTIENFRDIRLRLENEKANLHIEYIENKEIPKMIKQKVISISLVALLSAVSTMKEFDILPNNKDTIIISAVGLIILVSLIKDTILYLKYKHESKEINDKLNSSKELSLRK